MNTATHGATQIPGLFEPMPIRRRADLPALRGIPDTAHHDFLVTNLCPDLIAEPTHPREQALEQPRFVEPDSIFWSPEAEAGDAA